MSAECSDESASEVVMGEKTGGHIDWALVDICSIFKTGAHRMANCYQVVQNVENVFL